MSNVIFMLMQIFMGVVLYSLLGVIVAGGYHMLTAKLNCVLSLGLPNDDCTVGIICVIWPMFLLLVILASVFSKPIEKLGTLICGLFAVEDSSVVEKENK